jgi:hypothetical protein
MCLSPDRYLSAIFSGDTIEEHEMNRDDRKLAIVRVRKRRTMEFNDKKASMVLLHHCRTASNGILEGGHTSLCP